MVCYSNETLLFFYTHSKKEISILWGQNEALMISLGLLVCVFVIFANILVMMAIFMNRRFHYPIYYLLGNLAAADLFAGLSYFYLIFRTGPWIIKLSVYQWFVRQARRARDGDGEQANGGLVVLKDERCREDAGLL